MNANPNANEIVRALNDYFNGKELRRGDALKAAALIESQAAEIERLTSEANADYSGIADTMAGMAVEIARLRRLLTASQRRERAAVRCGECKHGEKRARPHGWPITCSILRRSRHAGDTCERGELRGQEAGSQEGDEECKG